MHAYKESRVSIYLSSSCVIAQSGLTLNSDFVDLRCSTLLDITSHSVYIAYIHRISTGGVEDSIDTDSFEFKYTSTGDL